jgi:peptidyl-prolyl cis-trans isomerase B (cyclophilin B)
VPNNEQRREQAKRKLERQLVRRQQRAKRRRLTALVGTSLAVIVVAGGVYFLATRPWSSGDAAATPGESSAAQPSNDKPASIPADLAAPLKRPTPLPAKVSCDYPAAGAAAKPVQAPAAGEVSAEGTVGVTVATSVGDLKLTLDRTLAPCTVNSFVNLAKQAYYNDTSCHRLTTAGILVLQCGDPTKADPNDPAKQPGTGGPGYSFKDEVFPELKYGRGVLAMANSGPDTNGSQFFIVYGDSQLEPKYTVFGSIDADSLKHVDEVANAGTNSGQGDGKPNTPVDIKTATVVE